ncbi:XRE family transcriptional regulator [Hymenobacter nivis]|uniref:HTH cro/C1-type domain-containing protein n=1 Tax=Hymenobacter nivis TaxID=1850093 RepID=A0A2Z3GKY3_9BACT|nr:XRE family transcriptional regulator [Hymenobacter nivis]AWM34869.1 hypothetical protein DDQ68_20055 [Hymenobacter nivis]
MFTRRAILSRPTYWLTEIRMDLMRAVEDYMQTHNMNRRQLAEHLECSPGYVSQMLNGDTNVSLEKLCDVALAVGKVPSVKFEDLDIVLSRDAIQCETSYEVDSTKSDSVHLIYKKPMRIFSTTESLIEA